MSAFVDALRRLDAEASPAPFRHGADYALYDAKGDAVVQYGDEVGPYLGGVNDDLFILLRNAAPEIAAVIEAAWIAVGECGLNGSIDKLDAALSRLDGKARGASVPDESEGRGEVKP